MLGLGSIPLHSTNQQTTTMKNLLIAATALLAFTSCEQPSGNIELNTLDGWYKVDLQSTSTSGYLGGVDSDTLIMDVGHFAFDYGTLYTLNMDSAVTPLPLLGILWETEYEFSTELNDTALQIGTETFHKFSRHVRNGVVEYRFRRDTQYFGMGTDKQTIILTEL